MSEQAPVEQININEQSKSILKFYIEVQDVVNDYVKKEINLTSKNVYTFKNIIFTWTMIIGWFYLFGWIFVLAPILSQMITDPKPFTIFSLSFLLVSFFGVIFIFLPKTVKNKKRIKASVLISVVWYPIITVLLSSIVLYIVNNTDPDVRQAVRVTISLSLFVSLFLAPLYVIIYLGVYKILTTELSIFFATQLKTKYLGNLSGAIIPDEQSFISSIVESIMSSEPNKLPDLPTHGWQSILDMSAQRTDGMSIRQDTFAVLATTASLVGVALSIMDGGFSSLRDLLIRLVTSLDGNMSIENTQVTWLFLGVLAVFMLFVFRSTLKIYENSFTTEVLQKVCIYKLYECEEKRISDNKKQEDQPNGNESPNRSFWNGVNRCATNISSIILHNTNSMGLREVDNPSDLARNENPTLT